MIATSLASAARPFWRLLEHCHIDAERVFREAGLDPALMDKPRERYRVEQRTAAWVKAAELTDDPCFGLRMAEVLTPTDLHALGYAFLASGTLRTALGRLSRYVQIINDAIGFRLEDAGDRVAFSLTAEPAAYPSLLLAQEDSLWAWIMALCRTVYGQPLDPVEVWLLHPEVDCQGRYVGFFRAPVRFGSETSAIFLAHADLNRPLPASNRELALANDRILTEFLNKLRKDDLVSRVKTEIMAGLPSGSPAEEDIAKAVCLSARTLNRKLAALGTSYFQLLETVRRELALQYIADPALSLNDVSFLLGFSEQSTFSRAFRRWTGQAPSAARERAAA